MRPPTSPSHPTPDPAESRLDRVWAATRPDAPAPEVLDALWAHASAELDRLGAAPAPAVPSRTRAGHRPWRRVGSGLATAAAVLLAAGLALRHGADGEKDGPIMPLVATVAPTTPALPTTRSIIDVGADQTLVVRLEADGLRVDLQPQPEPSGASTMLAEGTPFDVFNALESCATP